MAWWCWHKCVAAVGRRDIRGKKANLVRQGYDLDPGTCIKNVGRVGKDKGVIPSQEYPLEGVMGA